MSENHETPDVTNVSRRGFLKGFGAGTAAASLFSPVSLRESMAAEKRGALGPGEIPVVLQINGLKRELRIEPRVTLLDAWGPGNARSSSADFMSAATRSRMCPFWHQFGALRGVRIAALASPRPVV
jgi:hypothetical protein